MRNFFSLLIFIALASSCAQVLSPDGGAKDLVPPKVVDYSPDSAQTNFTGKKIVLRFNEFVQLKDLNNQLVVSPPLKNDPDVTIRKKDIVIEIRDTLLPNTTYTISFGNAISDITEGNVLDNFRYVFSTGPIIDSIKLAGKIVNAATLNGEKGILVMLYAATGDSIPLKQRPYYFTKTKEDGSFLITNIKAGKYKVFALDDKNSNYLFDNKEERIAFADQPINLYGNIDSLNLKLFKEDPIKQARVKAQELAAGRFSFAYALPLKNPEITFSPNIPPSMELNTEISVTGDSVDFWFSTVSLDTVTFIIADPANNFKDSIALYMLKPGDKNKKVRTGSIDTRKLFVSPNIQTGQLFDIGKSLMINTNNPLKTFKPENFILMKGKDTLKTNITLSANKRLLFFNTVFVEDSVYSLFVKPGAVTDWFGQKNDTVKVSFKVRESRYYGTLNIKLNGLPPGNYLLRLVNEKDAVIREMKISELSSLKFELLPPGTYRLKLIADDNTNGKWDSGNYLQHKQPERVIYYANPIKMRSGWDMDVEWIFK